MGRFRIDVEDTYVSLSSPPQIHTHTFTITFDADKAHKQRAVAIGSYCSLTSLILSFLLVAATVFIRCVPEAKHHVDRISWRLFVIAMGLQVVFAGAFLVMYADRDVSALSHVSLKERWRREGDTDTRIMDSLPSEKDRFLTRTNTDGIVWRFGICQQSRLFDRHDADSRNETSVSKVPLSCGWHFPIPPIRSDIVECLGSLPPSPSTSL